MNKFFATGNLTRDPELRTTQAGHSVCSFGLAVNRRRKVEGQPEVDFFNVTAWRGLAESCAQYLTKGRKVCVVGAAQIRTYTGRDGTEKTVVDIEADDVEFLPSGQGAGTAAQGEHSNASPSQFIPMPDDEEMPF